MTISFSFHSSGRTDIAFFIVEIPENCIGVLMTVCLIIDFDLNFFKFSSCLSIIDHTLK